MWSRTLKRADDLRRRLSGIDGVRVFGEDDLPPGAELDRSKVLVDILGLGVSGYAIDDWLNEHHRVSVGLSDARHLLAIVSVGTTAGPVRALVRGLTECAKLVHSGEISLPAADTAPGIGSLEVEMAIDPADAVFGAVEQVRLENAAGRIAAEVVAPAPPGVPRLVPGQRITPAHVTWMTANRDSARSCSIRSTPASDRCGSLPRISRSVRSDSGSA